MPVCVGVIKEIDPGERRVAMVPDVVGRLTQSGFAVLVEKTAGIGAGFGDDAFQNAGARLKDDAATVLAESDVVAKIQPPGLDEIDRMKEAGIMIAFMQAHRHPDRVARLRDRRLTSFAMELMPRITRAQTMDALSSQATVAGYKAVLLAANKTGRFFPMLTTAAGTIRPARVLVMGAGVAGLQAIATAHRLGAIVEAYDVRRAAGEQVASLGARFLALEIDAEADGGYARELNAEEKQREQEMLARHVGEADIVITTALIPGRDAPRLITREMVAGMKRGAVIVDLAAESGGNCEVTRPGEEFEHGGVRVIGPVNLAATLPVHASEMYSKNIFNFLMLLSKDGAAVTLDWNDEILQGSVLTHEGRIPNARMRQMLEGGQS